MKHRWTTKDVRAAVIDCSVLGKSDHLHDKGLPRHPCSRKSCL